MKRLSLIIISFVFLHGFLSAQNRNAEPRLEPDQSAFEFAEMGSNGNYSWEELLDMALWASGAAYSPESSVRSSIAAAVESLIAAEDLPSTKEAQGEYLLDYMHRTFLKNYSVNQTRLDLLVTTGRFNCVSSAVLYTILASGIGLETNGVLTRDHAFIQVNTGAELVDVETTTLYGYDPGSKKEFHDEFGNATGFAYVTPQNYRNRSPISQLELVSLILSNRIADLEPRGFYADAVCIAVDKEALLSMRTRQSDSPFFSDPHVDVFNRIFNYGASLIQAGRDDEVLAWADTAESRYPDERWQSLVFTAMNNQIVKMLRSKKIADARIFLDTEVSRLIPENYVKLEILVSDAELVQLTTLISTSEEAEQALERIDQVERQGFFSAARITELRNYVLLKESERRAKSFGWQEAITYIENTVNNYGGNAQLQNALNVYKNNKAIDFHNQFAVLFNARNYGEALELVQNALEEFPGNRQLTSDLRTVERAMQ